jgi:hypothetical protein
VKYTADRVKEITDFLAQGMSRDDSCDLVGINQDTFYDWMKRPEFSEAVLRAEKQCKQRNIVRIQNASKKDWRAAAWWMERKHPEEYAFTTKHDVSGEAKTLAEGLGRLFGNKPSGADKKGPR